MNATATDTRNPFEVAYELTIGLITEADKVPARLVVTDLCGRVRADVPWDGTRADVRAGAERLAAEVFGGVYIITTSGLRYYPEELGL